MPKELSAEQIDEAILRLESPSDDVREEAVASLVGVTEKRIVPPLIKCLLDKHPGVTHFAKKALLKIQQEHGDIQRIISELSSVKEPQRPEEVPGGETRAEEARAESQMDQGTRAAVDAILEKVRSRDAAFLPKLLKKLPSEDNPFIQATIISAIGKLGSENNYEALLPYLSDGDYRVVANTVEALERLGNPACVDSLTRILNHPDSRVRGNVVKAIWKFTDSSMTINRHTLEKLKEMYFSGQPRMRESAIFVLGEMADEESIELIKAATNDKNAAVRKKAQDALEKAVRLMAERRASESEFFASRVIENLAKQEQASPGKMDQATRKVIDGILDLVKKDDRKTVPAIVKRLRSERNPYIIATLVSAIGKLGSKSEMDVLLPFLASDDTRVVANCVEALEHLENPKCLEHLIKLIAHQDNRVRGNVVKAIWKFTHTNVKAQNLIIERLREMARSAKPKMRESSIFVLREIGSEEAADVLGELCADKTPAVRKKAEEALEKVRLSNADRSGREPEAFIEEVIEDLSPEKRQMARTDGEMDDAARRSIDGIMAAVGSRELSRLPEFVKWLSWEKNPFIRATLISAVGSLGGKHNMDSLLPHLADPDPRIVANTIEALEKIGNPKCAENLIELVSHQDNRIKANAVKAVWNFSSSNQTACRLIMNRLKEMILSTKAQMAESAIFVLGEIGSEEAVELLTLASGDRNPAIRSRARDTLEALRVRERRDDPVHGENVRSEENARARGGSEPPARPVSQAPALSAKPASQAADIAPPAPQSKPPAAKPLRPAPAAVSGRPPEVPEKTASPDLLLKIAAACLALAAAFLFFYKNFMTAEKEPSSAGFETPGPPSDSKKTAAASSAENGAQYLQEGFFVEAIAAFEERLKSYPGDRTARKSLAEARFKRAEELFKIEMYDSAREELRLFDELGDACSDFRTDADSIKKKIESIFSETAETK